MNTRDGVEKGKIVGTTVVGCVRKEVSLQEAWNALLKLDELNTMSNHTDIAVKQRGTGKWYVYVSSVTLRHVNGSTFSPFEVYADSPDEAVFAAYEAAINPETGWELILYYNNTENSKKRIVWKDGDWVFLSYKDVIEAQEAICS